MLHAPGDVAVHPAWGGPIRSNWGWRVMGVRAVRRTTRTLSTRKKGSRRLRHLTAGALVLTVIVVTGAVSSPLASALATGSAPGAASGHKKSPPESTLNDVSCLSTTFCMSVGTTESEDVPMSGLAQEWDGTGWATLDVPAPEGDPEVNLSAVSCPSTTSCIAVGSAATGEGAPTVTLAETWNGSTWNVVPTPSPEGLDVALSDVSCPSTDTCVAVGGYETGAGYQGLAETWNGSSWSTLTGPDPAGAVDTWLEGVSCTSSSCTAVGSYKETSAGDILTLADVWDGTSWSVQTTPNAAGATSSWFDRVSCTSSAACSATGYSYGGTKSTVFAEVWDGTSWALQGLPVPAGGKAGLVSGISCLAASDCVATGYYEAGKSLLSLADVSDTSGWQVQPTPNVHKKNGTNDLWTMLGAVSCTSQSDCVAVGAHRANRAQPDRELVEDWDGTSWAIENVSPPTG